MKKVLSFKDIVNHKGFTTEKEIRDYLEGKEITILNTNGGHNYGAVGEIIKFNNLLGAYVNLGGSNPSLDTASVSRNNILFSQFSVKEEMLTKESLEAEKENLNANIEEMQKEIKSIMMKLSFMKSNGLKAFDEDEFKVYKALTTLEDTSTSKMDKVKILAKLIKG